MNILLDECIPLAVLDFLKARSFDVVHVKQTEWAGYSSKVAIVRRNDHVIRES